MSGEILRETLFDSFSKVEAYARSHDYAGYCKFDALNSPFLENCFGHTALTRLLTTQLVNRIPLPLREILGVQRTRNPKGIANFIKAYVAMSHVQPSQPWLDHARPLADWLLQNDSRQHGAYQGSGRSWGYSFPWQSPGFYAPRHFPNCIVTVFCAEALLALYTSTQEKRYRTALDEAVEFIQRDLPVLESTDRVKCIGYVPQGLRWKVVNINAVTGGFLAKWAQATNQAPLQEEARRMLQWTVEARDTDFSWNYTAPKSQSGIGPDNYHTGGILDGLLDYMLASGDQSFMDVYRPALEFYVEHFFTAEGAPRWRVNRTYPQDIHGAAQGILTLVKAAQIDPQYLPLAGRIAQWARTYMQNPKSGHFYYQKFPGFTWKLDLMRWNNSWMAWALTELLQTMYAQNRMTLVLP